MIELVDGHVLFHWPANWAVSPRRSRKRQGGLAVALTGAEARVAMRDVARERFEWRVTLRNVNEQAEFESAVYAAAKSGLACAPRWGRGFLLTSDASGTSIELQSGRGAKWKTGDWVFLQAHDDLYDAREVTGVVDDTLTVSALSREYPAGSYCWRLVFGKFESDPARLLGEDAEHAALSISEMVSRDSATIGNVAGPGTGIGAMIVESDFQVT